MICQDQRHHGDGHHVGYGCRDVFNSALDDRLYDNESEHYRAGLERSEN